MIINLENYSKKQLKIQRERDKKQLSWRKCFAWKIIEVEPNKYAFLHFIERKLDIVRNPYGMILYTRWIYRFITK